MSIANRARALTLITILMLVACAPQAFAALTVEIVRPAADPFEVVVNKDVTFEAVAFLDGEELASGTVSWEWAFGDATAPSYDNPAGHAFSHVGDYVVTVTGTYGALQAQDTVTALANPPGGGDFEWYATPVDDMDYRFGGTVCDHVCFVCRASAEGVSPYDDFMISKITFEFLLGSTWITWRQPQLEMIDGHLGAVGAVWSSHEGEHNGTAYSFRAKVTMLDLTADPMDPNAEFDFYVPGDTGASYTPHNTVVTNTCVDDLIFHHATDTSHTISWDISHMNYLNPTFWATVEILTLGGSTVATLTDANAGIGAGSVTWDTDLPETDGIYTYRINAWHERQCEDQDKSEHLVVSNVNVAQVEFRSRELRLEGPVQYELSRDAGAAELTVYNQALDEVFNDSIDATQGQRTYVLSMPVQPDEMGTYYFVVRAIEDYATAMQNRVPGLAKPVLEQGTTKVILSHALDMYGRTSMGLGGPDNAYRAKQEQEHEPVGASYERPPYAPTVLGHDPTPVYWRLSSVDSQGAPNHLADAIFWYLGHGEPGYLHTDQTTSGKDLIFSGTGTNDETNDIYYIGNMPGGSLDRCSVAVIFACSSAVAPGNGDPSVLGSLMAKGAKAGIGTFCTVYAPEIPKLTDRFWELACRDGLSIRAAFEQALTDTNTPYAWFTDPQPPPGQNPLMPIGNDAWTLRPAYYQ